MEKVSLTESLKSILEENGFDVEIVSNEEGRRLVEKSSNNDLVFIRNESFTVTPYLVDKLLVSDDVEFKGNYIKFNRIYVDKSNVTFQISYTSKSCCLTLSWNSNDVPISIKSAGYGEVAAQLLEKCFFTKVGNIVDVVDMNVDPDELSKAFSSLFETFHNDNENNELDDEKTVDENR